MTKQQSGAQQILLVEDDRKVASFVCTGLEEEGYVVQWANSGEAGLEAAMAAQPDLVLLDLRLPDQSGLDVCRDLRRRFASLPILMLTALDAVPDRVAGLEAGADDYLPKPFSFDELLARVRALIRRSQLGPDSQVLIDGPLAMDLAGRSCTYSGSFVRLSPTEFDVLAYLLLRRAQAVHRDDVLSSVWGKDADAIPNVVDVYVGYVRRKLRAAGSDASIESVRGVGYRYVPEAGPEG